MEKIASITTIQAAPSRRDELLQMCKAHVRLMLADEPGTLRIELLMPPDDSDKLVVWEVYESLKAVEAHRTGERFRKFVEDTKDVMVGMDSKRHTLIE